MLTKSNTIDKYSYLTSLLLTTLKVVCTRKKNDVHTWLCRLGYLLRMVVHGEACYCNQLIWKHETFQQKSLQQYELHESIASHATVHPNCLYWDIDYSAVWQWQSWLIRILKWYMSIFYYLRLHDSWIKVHLFTKETNCVLPLTLMSLCQCNKQ